MSKPELVNVLTKMRRDKQYRAVVRTDPATALLRADLTAEERDALLAWEPARLEGIGVGAELAREALFGRDPFGGLAAVGAEASGGGASGCG